MRRWLVALITTGCTIDANVARLPVVITDTGVDVLDTSTKCPQKVGTATMIDLGDFCIDATETTRKEYAAFLAATPSNVPGSECFGNKFVPLEGDLCAPEKIDLTRDTDHPVVCVDWCDAKAYCAWAGKRLCGAIGGAAVPYDDLAAHNDKNEWFTACAGGEAIPRKYPYRGEWKASVCADSALTSSPVGSHLECHGPPGTAQAAVYDMSGNVYEWVNSCQAGPTDPESQSCLTRGGFFRQEDSMDSWTACAVTVKGALKNTKPRGRGDDHIGIRCCAR